MPDILLATLNAKYPHAAFGLRYLLANLEPAGLAHRAKLLEFDINQRPTDILESLLAQNPKIIGLGVYIWNATESTTLAAGKSSPASRSALTKPSRRAGLELESRGPPMTPNARWPSLIRY